MNEGKVATVHHDTATSSEILPRTPPVWDLQSSSPKVDQHLTHEKVEEDEEEYISPLPPLSTISSSQSEAEVDPDHPESDLNHDPDFDLAITQTLRPKFLQPHPSSFYDPCKPLLGSTLSPDSDVQLALENAKHPDQYTIIAIPGIPRSIRSYTPIGKQTPDSSFSAITPALNVEEVDCFGVGNAKNIPNIRRNSSSSSLSSSTSMDSLSVEAIDEAALSSASAAGSFRNAPLSDATPPPIYDSPTDFLEDVASPEVTTTVEKARTGSVRFSIPRVSTSPPPDQEEYEVYPLHRQARHRTPDQLAPSGGVSRSGLWKHLRNHTHRKRKRVGHRHYDKLTVDPETVGETSTKSEHPHNPGRHRLHKVPHEHTTRAH